MPSESYKVFKNRYMLDIEKLISNYEDLKGGKRGKRSLDHLMRSGVLLLAAAWEVYIEEVLYESAIFVASNISPDNISPDNISLLVKKNISKAVIKKVSKNELAPFINISGEAWRDFYQEIVWEDIEKLNTPKESQINDLFSRHLGIDEISSNFRHNNLDNFICFRGEIAHRINIQKGEMTIVKP